MSSIKVPFHVEVGIILSSLVLGVMLLVPGCTVQQKKDDNGKKVKIETPVGGLRVNTEANPADTGLAVYPGARLKPKSKDDSSSANVSISTSVFGLKVVALGYESDDPPQKVIDFYKKELAKYGNVLECRNGVDERDGELSCAKGSKGEGHLELVAGRRERRRMVPVEPSGNGTKFGLIYIQVGGKDNSL